ASITTGYLTASLVAAISSAVASAEGARPRQMGEPAGRGPSPAVADAWPAAPGSTVYRTSHPRDARLPVAIWSNRACRDNGLSASHFLREIASHGYLVIANGSAREEEPPRGGPAVSPPRRAGDPPPTPPARTADETSVAQHLGAIDWAERANSGDGALARRVDSSRVAAMGHSCGGLQALS